MHHTIDINVVHYRIPSTPVRIFLMRIQNMCVYIYLTHSLAWSKKKKKRKRKCSANRIFSSLSWHDVRRPPFASPYNLIVQTYQLSIFFFNIFNLCLRLCLCLSRCWKKRRVANRLQSMKREGADCEHQTHRRRYWIYSRIWMKTTVKEVV